jgi:uncharacterized membrane-anchored protein
VRARHFSYNPPATQHRQAWARAGHLNMRNNGSMTAMTVISFAGLVLVFVLVFLLLWYFR